MIRDKLLLRIFKSVKFLKYVCNIFCFENLLSFDIFSTTSMLKCFQSYSCLKLKQKNILQAWHRWINSILFGVQFDIFNYIKKLITEHGRQEKKNHG